MDPFRRVHEIEMQCLVQDEKRTEWTMHVLMDDGNKRTMRRGLRRLAVALEVRMIEEEPTNEFRDKSFQKYDAVIANAPLTDTTRQLAFLQKYTMWKDGLPIPMSSLLADIDMQDKDKMLEIMEKEQQQQ